MQHVARSLRATVVALAFDSLGFKERGISGREFLKKRDELTQAQKDLRESIAGALQNELTAIENHIRDSEVTSEGVIMLNVLITVAALLLALFLGAILARSISQPITQLTEMVNSLGRTSTRTLSSLSVSSNDEVGQLCRAFKQMTERLKETTVSRDALAKEVTERRRAEEDLAVRADELRRSNTELTQFLSVASHDLQEPLRKVQAFGDLLARKSRDSLTGDSLAHLERMQASAARMQNLIQDLQAFSRIATQTRTHVSVDLTDAAQRALSDLETQLKETGGRAEVGELPTIDADPALMQELLRNLVSNGLKFHRPGEPPIVKVEAHLLDGRENGAPRGVAADKLWELTVEDNGIGFDEKYLDRIFTVFQRLHGDDGYQGTGMGLALCQKIVERHGGNITARSEPGHGATFVVRLPVKQAHDNGANWSN